MGSVTVFGMVIMVQVRTGLQPLCYEVTLPHSSHWTPSSDAVRKTRVCGLRQNNDLYFWQKVPDHCTCQQCLPLLLLGNRECVTFMGALYRTSESTLHKCLDQRLMTLAPGLLWVSLSVPTQLHTPPEVVLPHGPSTPTFCCQPPPWIPQESGMEKRDVEWCEWQLPKSNTGPPGFVNCY